MPQSPTDCMTLSRFHNLHFSTCGGGQREEWNLPDDLYNSFWCLKKNLIVAFQEPSDIALLENGLVPFTS